MSSLPIEIVNLIMSYLPDPEVSKRQAHVLSQINYNYNEFRYLREKPSNVYYGWDETRFYKFAMRRSQQKQDMKWDW